jgi:hypothetical protein
MNKELIIANKERSSLKHIYRNFIMNGILKGSNILLLPIIFNE